MIACTAIPCAFYDVIPTLRAHLVLQLRLPARRRTGGDDDDDVQHAVERRSLPARRRHEPRWRTDRVRGAASGDVTDVRHDAELRSARQHFSRATTVRTCCDRYVLATGGCVRVGSSHSFAAQRIASRVCLHAVHAVISTHSDTVSREVVIYKYVLLNLDFIIKALL